MHGRHNHEGVTGSNPSFMLESPAVAHAFASGVWVDPSPLADGALASPGHAIPGGAAGATCPSHPHFRATSADTTHLMAGIHSDAAPSRMGYPPRLPDQVCVSAYQLTTLVMHNGAARHFARETRSCVAGIALCLVGSAPSMRYEPCKCSCAAPELSPWYPAQGK